MFYVLFCTYCMHYNKYFLKRWELLKAPRDRIFDRIYACNFPEDGLRERMKMKEVIHDSHLSSHEKNL